MGAGESGDTHPYAVAREVEDIVAVLETLGELVHLFGHSSGALLAFLLTRGPASACARGR